MMIFLSLRVTADAEGGLKIRAHQRLDLQGIGGSSHQQARAGIYRGIACRYYAPNLSPVPTSLMTYKRLLYCHRFQQFINNIFHDPKFVGRQAGNPGKQPLKFKIGRAHV